MQTSRQQMKIIHDGPDELLDPLAMTSSGFMAAAMKRGISRPVALEHYRDHHQLGRCDAEWIRPALSAPSMLRRDDTTIKFLMDLEENTLQTESVLIPMTGSTGRTTTTLCLSSQVGCAMGCRFCQTGRMGLLHDLQPRQIVGQWHAARHHLGHVIKNIVFMGMGEPTDNIEAVIQSIRILADHHGPAIAPRNITVSTVGNPRGIQRLSELAAEDGFHRLNLAVSINAPNDRIRSEIMPVNRAWSMAELKQVLLAWPLRPSGRFCIEYVLIPGVNDGMDDADELCRYLDDIPCTLNIIPYNPIDDSPWPAPEQSVVDRFIERTIRHGQFTKRRKTKGRATMAACGQLGNTNLSRPSRRRSMLQDEGN
ncbi:MAG: 23S rRNA (adenine(2503)-C(2))-methyltransferase RlmN [Phycisphaerae bacterium]|nr:23S rRNA (adenine(2503)-C(2))-methyltransferase RlmN [Phycisphaerae bacterium]